MNADRQSCENSRIRVLLDTIAQLREELALLKSSKTVIARHCPHGCPICEEEKYHG
ncbi:MAG: hypothetical protein HY395_01740 [Candidatus Doudnabacteria bacterium]|nr:hypothetical protein [Candidatus Doudnabacteria bacterium]